MPRGPVLLSGVVVALLGLVAAARRTDAARAGHPLVGAWLLSLPDEPDASPRLNSYTADGIAVQTHPAGTNAQGVWAPTGERTAVLTLLLLGLARGATQGTGRVRAVLEVDATGDAFTGSFTVEFVAADGASRGEEAPLRVAGTRVRAEPPAARATPPAAPTAR